MANRLAIPAVRQILAKLAKGEKEEEELVEKLEDSCLRYDHDKKGVRDAFKKKKLHMEGHCPNQRGGGGKNL